MAFWIQSTITRGDFAPQLPRCYYQVISHARVTARGAGSIFKVPFALPYFHSFSDKPRAAPLRLRVAATVPAKLARV